MERVGYVMDDLLAQQIEALEVAIPYCEKISNAIGNVTEELNGHRQEDTDEYISSIFTGVNWIIEVYNGTRELINKDSVIIDKDTVNASIFNLNAAYNAKNDVMLSDAFGEVKDFVTKFMETARSITDNK